MYRFSQKLLSSPSWVHFVSLIHECLNQSNYFKSVKWSMCEKACAESCCLCYKLIYKYSAVFNVTASSQISTLNRDLEMMLSAQKCVLPLLPSLLSNGFITQNCLLREKLSE